jgi:pyruvate dehydrogenase E1 component alpha subunit
MSIIMTFTREEMMETYEKLSFCRFYEKKYEDGAISGAIKGFTHVALGEEAVFAALLTERGPNDWLFPNDVRDLSLFAAIFGPRDGTAEANGRFTGVNQGVAGVGHAYSKEKRFGPCFALLGQQNGVAAGIALGMKLNKVDGCVICAAGDGTMNEGMVSESLNLAAIYKLPYVIIVQNNKFGLSMAADKSSAVPLTQRVEKGFGIPCEVVDGQDVLAVKAAFRQAFAKARKGEPVGLEVRVRRWTGHFVGDPQKYRDKAELSSARDFDPYKRYREYLTANKVAAAEELDAIDKKNKEIIDDAFEYALAQPIHTKEFIRQENAKKLYA